MNPFILQATKKSSEVENRGYLQKLREQKLTGKNNEALLFVELYQLDFLKDIFIHRLYYGSQGIQIHRFFSFFFLPKYLKST